MFGHFFAKGWASSASQWDSMAALLAMLVVVALSSPRRVVRLAAVDLAPSPLLLKMAADVLSSSTMYFSVGAGCWLLRHQNALTSPEKIGGGSCLAMCLLLRRTGVRRRRKARRRKAPGVWGLLRVISIFSGVLSVNLRGCTTLHFNTIPLSQKKIHPTTLHDSQPYVDTCPALLHMPAMRGTSCLHAL